jgi:repressor LexA
MALTRRQREVLEVIRAFIDKNGYSPSLEEIGAALGLSSVATVHKHVTHLVDKGLVRRVWNQNRSIELVDEASRKPCSEVPVTGLLAPGASIQPLAAGETALISPDLSAGRARLFALKVGRDSDLDPSIRADDLLYVEDRRSARDGEVVVATVDGNDVVVGRFAREGMSIRLSALADASRAQLLDQQRLEVNGIVVALLRRFPNG